MSALLARLGTVFLTAAAMEAGFTGDAEAQSARSGKELFPPVSEEAQKPLVPDAPLITDSIILRNIAEFRTQFPELDCAVFEQDNVIPHVSAYGIPCERGGEITIAVPAASDGGRSFRDYWLTDYFLMQNEIVEDFLPPPRIPDDPVFQNDIYWQYFIFDHEVGHAHFSFMRESRDPETPYMHGNENFADLYAIIRHYQRFGTDTRFADALIDIRGRMTGFINSDYAWNHLSPPTLLHLAQAVDKEDLARMTARQAIDVAARTLRESALSSEELRRLNLIARAEQEKIKDASRTVAVPAAHYPVAVAARMIEEGFSRDLTLVWLASVRRMHEYSVTDSSYLNQAYESVAAGQPLLRPPEVVRTPPDIMKPRLVR